MISTILATDMSLHHSYMAQMAALTERCEKAEAEAEGGRGLEAFSGQEIEAMRTSLCALAIKAADISNVVRYVSLLYLLLGFFFYFFFIIYIY